MSYIRTKDAVYEVIKNELGECIKIDGGFVMLEDVRLIEQNIIESDNLAELCDEFVVAFEENNDRITYLDLDWAIDKAKRYAGHTTIYGAVWCEWGLKYVAKMNNNGELILI